MGKYHDLMASEMRTRGLAEYLFPVRALSKRMRGAMRAHLLRAAARGELDLGAPGSADEAVVRRGLYEAKWLVYAKAPFGRAHAVFAYLGKYTHRVGISNRRLDAYDGERVTFATKHGAHATIDAPEFVRRLALHVLPAGLHKIRHLGLASAVRLRNGDLTRAMHALPSNRAPPEMLAVMLRGLLHRGFRRPTTRATRRLLSATRVARLTR